jgi:hypothetical protein
VTAVRCINCAGGTSVPTILALVFGGVAAFAAARGLAIQASEHDRLTTELGKRADFDITIRPVSSDCTRVGSDSADLTLTSAAMAVSINLYLCFEIGLSNTGQRAATHTVLDVLAHARYFDLKWCAPNGGDLPEPQPSAATTSEPIHPDDLGGSAWISREIDRVALRGGRVSFVRFGVTVPPDETLDVYLRAKAQSDDLPDEVVERIKDYVLHISRS